jgi:drug/metabolite transporter (DMT)-like permease
MSFALGISSALVAPFMMVLGFIIWDNHWNGSAFSLNLYKCNLAAIGFAIVSLYGRYSVGAGFAQPDTIFTTEKVGFLMLSSTIGILIGDWTWLEGMRLLGARKVIVMDSLKPFLAALLGEIFLGETLQPAAFVGLMLTVVGVSLVGLEKENITHEEQEAAIETDPEPNSPFEIEVAFETEDSLLLSYAEQRKNRKLSTRENIYGLTMAVLNVILHTFGALLTKKYGVGMTTWEINFIRFGFSGMCMTLLSFSLRLPQTVSDIGLQYRRVSNEAVSVAAHDTVKEAWYRLPEMKLSSWMRISLGVAFVSFFMPALTNYAMFQISLALLLTLESIGPLYSLPLSFLLQNERPTYRACIGAILAVAGILVFSYKGMIE